MTLRETIPSPSTKGRHVLGIHKDLPASTVATLTAPSPSADGLAGSNHAMAENATTAVAKTVLFVTAAEAYGGAEKHLLQRLVDRNKEFRAVIACTLSDPFSARLDPRDTVEVISSKRPEKTFWEWVRLFRKVRPDLVVFEHGALYCFRWPQYLAARIAGVRRIFAIQHLVPVPVIDRPQGSSLKTKIRRTFGWRARHVLPWRFMAMLGDKTICVSEAVRKSLIEHYDFPARNVVTILNGVDVSEFAPSESTRSAIRARLGLRADDFVMVATARLSKVKAPEILVRAFAEVIERGHPCKCILVGDGPLREQVQDQVRNLGLSEHAIFVGFQADVKPFLQAADLFVLTSWQEGMSLALLEALACALPCVVTNVGGNAEVICNSQDGFVVEPGEVSKIADAISYLVERPEERRRMAGQAREKAEQTFDIRVCLKAIEQEMFGEWASRR